MKKILVLAGCLALLHFSACSSDDDGTQNSEPDTTTTEDLAGEEEVAETPPPQCPDLPDLTGRAYRVTTLTAKDPTDKLNEVWAADIAAYDLVLVFHVVEHDTEAETLKLQVTSAKAEKTDNGDGTFTPVKYNYMLEPATFDAYFEGCRIRWDSPIELNIVTATISKPFRAFGITGYVDMSQEGTEITNSWLSGAILETDTQDLCLTIPGLGQANFHGFMNFAKICPTFDSDGDDVIDSYKFSGQLKATDETQYFDLEVVGFETDVVCDVHTEACIPLAD